MRSRKLQEASRVRLKEPRIAPLTESQWSEQQRTLLAPIKQATGIVINIISTLARHPTLYERFMPFSSYITAEQSLPARDREILILRIGWLCQSEYEFGQHTLFGKAMGLKDEEIFRITKGPEEPGWSLLEAALIRATDELHKDAFITDATWKALAEKYTENQLMDIIFIVGQYNLVSMALNSLGVQREPGVPGFPKEGTAVQAKKKFAHTGTPAFFIEYPENFVTDPLQPNAVLRAKSAGGVPIFEITVQDPPKEMEKPEDYGKTYIKNSLEPLGSEIKILSQKPAKLKDGTPSREFTIGWKFNGTLPLLSLLVEVQKDDKIVSFGGHTMGDLTPLSEIVQTWEFK